MKIHFATAASSVILPLVLALLPAGAAAQQVPVTGQMLGDGGTAAAAQAQATAVPAAAQTSTAVTVPLNSGYAAAPPAVASVYVAPAAAAPSPVGQHRSPGTSVGETTRNLLQMQVDGSQAGKPLPMLGVEASASYSRYLKSFNHDIPEFYKTTVGNSSNSGGNSSGYGQ
ncbi:DUF3613 domain-containing protein [Rhodanobacter sp. A1T4]|uniref:DUF3613 domain-containing protein n=1 Tax=Rhodanobacter sp. A1T4 TaxID=2723087 RepID=UPI00160ED5E1|nr:DUF3613 domain-containing protein [Rhodanobacter sp. A1T4]MBB6249364.1 hypothetical protein [Rhodanobacter sp. A1T4]